MHDNRRKRISLCDLNHNRKHVYAMRGFFSINDILFELDVMSNLINIVIFIVPVTI